MMWTHFWDMHSGGGIKEKWAHIYIEAPEAEAVVIFYNRFGHNPNRITCTCCGEDYAISSDDDLAQLTQFHRGSRALDAYLASPSVLAIHADEIKDAERVGDAPTQGYVWV
jgi:hypothetical protein